MHITNTKELAKTPLRKKALKIVEAGYAAIEITTAIKKRMTLKKGILEIAFPDKKTGNVKIDLDDYKRVFLIGIGKGSALASISLAQILGKRLTRGIAIDVERPSLEIKNFKLEICGGTHPLPSAKNVKATQKIMRMVSDLEEDDLVIVFMCGGGSALAVGSDEELKASTTVFKELTKAGANIIELNTVRKHLSNIKGGNLAKLVFPATMLTLMASDVIGNDMEMIASGPTVRDTTTKADAAAIMKKYGVSMKDMELQETPKEEKYFRNVKNLLFISNRNALQAMADAAKKLGFTPRIKTETFQGEAKHALIPLVRAIKRGEALLLGGETTVTLGNVPEGKKMGKGGRNQEAVLGVIAEYAKKPEGLRDIVAISYASDGHDNTDAAGGVGDMYSIRASKAAKQDVAMELARHAAFECLKKNGNLLLAKKNSFNVADLIVVIKG